MATVEIIAEVKKESDGVFLLFDGSIEQWVPKSKLEHSHDPQIGETIAFEMPEWLAIEKEFV